MISTIALKLASWGVGPRLAGALSYLVLTAAAAGIIAAPVLYARHVEQEAYAAGSAAGAAVAIAEWQARYTALDSQWRAHVDTLTAEIAAAREAERTRLERAAADARALGETATTALYNARRRAEDLMQELHDERLADLSGDALCGTPDGVRRYNRAVAEAGAGVAATAAGGGDVR